MSLVRIAGRPLDGGHRHRIPTSAVIRTLARRVTVRTLDGIVERGRKSRRGPVRAAAGVLDKARGLVGLEGVPVRSPVPQWDGAYPEHPMWESDKKKLHKHQVDKGIIQPDAQEVEEAKQAAAAEKPIKVYFKRGCPHTRAAFELLDEREYAYNQIDVTDSETQRSWLKLVTGRNTTPQIFIGGDHIGGFDELRELEHAGELAKKVEEAAAKVLDIPTISEKKRIKLPILHPTHSPFEGLEEDAWADVAPAEDELEGDELVERVKEVLDECRPMVQADGGDIVLLDVQSESVRIELTGNCIGCPSAQATLKQGIERRLRNRIPQIRSISSPQLQ